MQKTLVTGVGGPAGRAVARFLRGAGFRVTGTDVRHVKGECDGFFLVPRGDSPAFSVALLDILRTERPQLLVSTVTEELPQIAHLKGRIRGMGTVVFSAEPDSVEVANDKYLTARTLGSQGIPVPRTLAGEEVSGGVHAGEILGFPLIAKPRHGRGGRGVAVHHTREDAGRESRQGIVYQEFLCGEEYDVNLFAPSGGCPTVVRVLLKTALREGIVGNAVSVRAVERDDIARLATEASCALRLEGPIDMDIRRNEYGEARIIEVNARAGAHVLEAAGVLEAMLDHTRKGTNA